MSDWYQITTPVFQFLLLQRADVLGTMHADMSPRLLSQYQVTLHITLVAFQLPDQCCF